jgi:putative Mg2+ transporter-C (MgtC) family protein|tara:strand:+ start:1408 stop:2106 length:699 start_codon:yes stop_codon:yes gene_type:complete
LPITLDAAALNLLLAMICGALIGSERQIRRRTAGLRTNALVALGAAGFVVFSGLYPDEVSPTRVAAQVVSGIGFLGAGIIFRHGFTVHGLNTAATLWCSAAVGTTAGGGAPIFAALLTGFVVFVNLGLRPLVKWIKKRTGAGAPPALEYQVMVGVETAKAPRLRALALQCLSQPGMQVAGIERSKGLDGDETLFEITVMMEDMDEETINKALSPLMTEPDVRSVGWEYTGAT